MTRAISVLVCSASPDYLNTNTALRNYVAKGFSAHLGEGYVWTSSLLSAPSNICELMPNLVVIFGSCMPDACDYSQIRNLCDKFGAGLVFWLHDDPYEFDFNYKIIPYADAIFTNDRWSCDHIKHHEVHHLPLAADPVDHYRDVCTKMDRAYFFCGVGYNNRKSIIQESLPYLKAHKGLICGAEWPSLSGFQNFRINNLELPDYYNRSAITLNIGRRYNLANRKYSLDATTPGPRTFEAAMAGAAQCYHFETPEILEYFDAEAEIILFDSPTELADILTKVTEDAEYRSAIAKQSQARCLKQHTYAQRADKILKLLKFLN